MIQSSVTSTPGEPPGASHRRAIIVLLTVISLMLLVIIAVVIALLMPQKAADIAGASSTPSAAPTATTAPTPTAPLPSAISEPEAPALAIPRITTFSVDPERVNCTDGVLAVPLIFSWTTTDAEQVWIGVNTEDAEANPFALVNPRESEYTSISFKCGFAEGLIYTLTAKGAGGTVHASVIVATES